MFRWTRLVALGGLLLSALLAAWPGGVEAAEDTQLYDAARKANETEITWYETHYRTEAAERIGQAFTAKYPGIKVNVFNSTAAVAFQRISQDLKAGAPQADVYSSTDASHLVTLKTQGHLQKYVPDNTDKVVESVRRLNDPEGFYLMTFAGLVALTYNADKVKADEAPRNWTDMLDPKWQGKGTVGSPNYSGTVGVWSVLMKRLYGMEFFDKLAANKPLVGRSVDDVLIHLNSGERIVAAAGDPASTARSKARGNPLGISYPTDGSLLLVGPTGVLKEAKHPNAAKLFVHFLLGPEAAKSVVADFEQSVSTEAPPPPSGRPLKDIKTAPVSVDEIIKELPGIKEKWRALFGN
jgi:iron(III) transport system substrate-binding protein